MFGRQVGTPRCKVCGGDHWVHDAYERRNIEIEARKAPWESLLAKPPPYRFAYDQMGNFLGYKDLSRNILEPTPELEEIMDYVLFAIRNDLEYVPLLNPPLFETLSEIEDTGMEEQRVEEYIPSWEEEFKDEFGEELMDFAITDEGEFDPLGDLKLLEDLIYNEPSLGIKKELCKESHEIVSDLVLPTPHLDCEKPKHEPYSISIRDVLRFKSLAKGTRRRISGRRNRSVMKRLTSSFHFIEPFLGEFKSWWAEFNSYGRAHETCAIGFFPTNCKRRVLRSIDGKMIKEKPPDCGFGSESD
ncbi:uncharacterized protein LOC143603744 [Bidens hawaiensis]|uniref:uncharacterized protein LOC143603744 n=1 Tax=Bidens hawaiensis TaxID=980011 RepID=UPI0040498999